MSRTRTLTLVIILGLATTTLLPGCSTNSNDKITAGLAPAATPCPTPIPDAPLSPSEERIGTTDFGAKVVMDELVVGVDMKHPNPDKVACRVAKQLGGQVVGSVPQTNTYQVMIPGATVDQLEGFEKQAETVDGVDFASPNGIASVD